MSNLFESAFIDEFSVFNLWGKGKISLKFDNRVTFLTGMNGSGKSTMLNVIFDSLICSPKLFAQPSTSKCRFWSSSIKFSNSVELQTILFPEFPRKNLELEEEISSWIEEQKDLGLETVRAIQDMYSKRSSDEIITYISNESNQKGEGWAKNLRVGGHDSIPDEWETPPLGFLFQEDRTTLHKLENCSLDRNSVYWGMYKSSIDERFVYCRDQVKSIESQANREIVKALSELPEDRILDIFDSSVYKEATLKKEGIITVVNKLNKYFKGTGKCITRDDDGKVTLGFIPVNYGSNDVDDIEEDVDDIEEDVEAISWNLLSRGEKTIIYLFFAVYLYKEKVRVFLLDEPEISFHVSWQKSLIRDLSDIAPDNQFIIATHSPSLVMDGWMDNCLDLKV